MIEDLINCSGARLRAAIRSGYHGSTAGLARNYVQTNILILPQAYAADFQLFCYYNEKTCALLDVLSPGNPHPNISPEADIRTDIGSYQIYENGRPVETVKDICALWRDDFVSFLIGCSFTFERAMVQQGIRMKHADEGKNVPMYVTDIPCANAHVP